MKFNSFAKLAGVAAALTLSAFPINAFAAGGHGAAGKTGPHGAPGNVGEVSRTIEITMRDNFYEPEEINIEEGQTIRFVVTNAGEFVHEFNIATPAMHKAHAPEMMMMVEHGVLEPDRINWAAAEEMKASMGHGMHEEGNSILLEPGETGELIWKFPKHAALEFACNIPGHYDSGMAGPVRMSH
jgi:uncharacterized cupredoxin-like copper-binding protein